MDSTHIDSLDLDARASLSAGADFKHIPALPQIGLRAIAMVDGPSAVNAPRGEGDYIPLAPCPTALGASWDIDLVARVGAMQGWEARARKVDLILGPNINMERSPLAGRAFEYFGEDPMLVGMIGAAWIQGVQSQGVGAVAKHLVCNDSETKRHSMNSVVDERTLREVYLRPFKMAADAGVWAMMTAYNRVNGTACAQHPINNDIVKGEWKFDGIVMSDWHGAHDTVASSAAGLDLEMPGPAKVRGPHLAAAIRDGRSSEDALNATVERVLRLAGRVGALGEDHRAPATPPADDLLLEAAAAGFVMLSNDGTLPLQPKPARRIAIIGPNADEPAYQGGTLGQIPLAATIPTPLQALRSHFADAQIVHAPGVLAAPRLPAISKIDLRPDADSEERGLSIAYYRGQDTDAAPAATETRARGSMIWFGVMPGTGPLAQPATIRASGTFLPETSGEHLIRTGGAGDLTVWLDGVQIGAKAKVIGQDTMGDLLWPQLLDIPVQLEAGKPVTIMVEMFSDAVRARSFHLAIRAPEPAGLLDAAVAAAADADVAIVIVGETTDNAMESVDRTTTSLPGAQDLLIEKICAANPRTIVVANVGHAIDTPWADKAAATLIGWFPGEAFGPVLAQIIDGTREPGGRLPVTFARQEADYPAFDLTPVDGDLHYSEGVLVGGRSLQARGISPRFPLGHGLGYADIQIESAELVHADGSLVRATLRNLSDRAGKAVVQIYHQATGNLDGASQLVAFQAVQMKAGEQRTVDVAIAPDATLLWSPETSAWTPILDEQELRVGLSLEAITHVLNISPAVQNA